MDASTAASTGLLSGVMTWMQVDGQVIHIFLQWIWWVATAFAAVFAAIQAKRLVDYKVAKAAGTAAVVAKDEDSDVAVDEFVD